MATTDVSNGEGIIVLIPLPLLQYAHTLTSNSDWFTAGQTDGKLGLKSKNGQPC